MFESDDFDQVLSQFDFPEVETVNLNIERAVNVPGSALSNTSKIQQDVPNKTVSIIPQNKVELTPTIFPKKINPEECNVKDVKTIHNKNDSMILKLDPFVSPKPTKRKIINSYFDHQSKRKFPGPAGLLTGALEEPKDESICQIELLSQDIDYTGNNLRKDLFETPIWKRLLDDAECWRLHDIDSIKSIKHQAVAGNLRKQKAQTVTAFIEAIDRSATDPLIILRDTSGSIKCTLHHDAWSTFSPYIVSEFCALVLQKPTVLTTGSAFKKHYLNITLSNIFAIYSSTVLNEDGRTLPDGYCVIYSEDYTVIKSEKYSNSSDIPLGQSNNAEDLFDGLDSIFSDDIF